MHILEREPGGRESEAISNGYGINALEDTQNGVQGVASSNLAVPIIKKYQNPLLISTFFLPSIQYLLFYPCQIFDNAHGPLSIASCISGLQAKGATMLVVICFD